MKKFILVLSILFAASVAGVVIDNLMGSYGETRSILSASVVQLHFSNSGQYIVHNVIQMITGILLFLTVKP